VVSAFTVGHSITLSLAALELDTVPARIVEPPSRCPSCWWGPYNLLARPGGRDLRPWYALGFGLVHGFGFASVLRDTGLPAGRWAWSCSLSIWGGDRQLVVVVTVAAAL
jgi:hypothetical protein